MAALSVGCREKELKTRVITTTRIVSEPIVSLSTNNDVFVSQILESVRLQGTVSYVPAVPLNQMFSRDYFYTESFVVIIDFGNFATI